MAIVSALLDREAREGLTEEQLEVINDALMIKALDLISRDPVAQQQLKDRCVEITRIVRNGR